MDLVVPNRRGRRTTRQTHFAGKVGDAADGAVEITDDPRRRRLPVDGPSTVNWALFEAVGRLAREPFEPLRFVLLDHFDQVKPNQTLSFRETAEVVLADHRRLLAEWNAKLEVVPPTPDFSRPRRRS